MRWAGSDALARFSEAREALRSDGSKIGIQSVDMADPAGARDGGDVSHVAYASGLFASLG